MTSGMGALRERVAALQRASDRSSPSSSPDTEIGDISSVRSGSTDRISALQAGEVPGLLVVLGLCLAVTSNTPKTALQSQTNLRNPHRSIPGSIPGQSLILQNPGINPWIGLQMPQIYTIPCSYAQSICPDTLPCHAHSAEVTTLPRRCAKVRALISAKSSNEDADRCRIQRAPLNQSAGKFATCLVLSM